MGDNCAAWVFKVCAAVLRIPVLYDFTVGEGNGHPKNHPQCTVWIHSELHPWCRSEVGITISFLHSYSENSGLEWNVICVIKRSTLDDVLLSYITGVLEDLGSQQSVEENFDVEVFAEMLEAYVPGFAEIDRWSVTLSLCILKQENLIELNKTILFFLIFWGFCYSFSVSKSVRWCLVWPQN